MPNKQWYLAEIVMHITVENDPRPVVHTNMVLVEASSNEEAYEKALQLGKEEEQTYENIEGKQVEFRFRGLHDLNLIHDELEHGAEIIYSEDIGMNESQIEALVAPKQNLGIFAPRKPTSGPDYASGDVMRKVFEVMNSSKNDK